MLVRMMHLAALAVTLAGGAAAQAADPCDPNAATFRMNGVDFSADRDFVIDQNDRLIRAWPHQDQIILGFLFRDAQSFEALNIACAARLDMHRNGRLASVTLAAPQQVNGFTLKDRLEFFDTGAIARGTLSQPAEIDGITYLGRFVLYPDGQVRDGVSVASTRLLLPLGRVNLLGQARVTFTADGVLSNVQGIGGGGVEAFGRAYSDARFTTTTEGVYHLAQGTLSKASAIVLTNKPMRLPSGSQILFNANHRPFAIILPTGTVTWNGVQMTSGTQILISDGRVTSIIPARQTIVDGITFPPRSTIPFDLAGRLVRTPSP